MHGKTVKLILKVSIAFLYVIFLSFKEQFNANLEFQVESHRN